MKFIYLALLTIFLSPYLSHAKAVDNLLPGLAKTGSGTVRYMGIFKVYDAELYTRPGLNSTSLLNADISKCLVLYYDLDISAKDIIKGADTVLKRQNSQDVLEQASHYIEVLHENYTNVRDGDSYTLCYDSTSSTTRLLYNGEEVVAINSPEFAKIYFGIWLGEKEPISEELRNDLLVQLSVNK